MIPRFGDRATRELGIREYMIDKSLRLENQDESSGNLIFEMPFRHSGGDVE